MTAFQAVDVSSILTTCSIVLSSTIVAIGRSQRSLRMRETFYLKENGNISYSWFDWKKTSGLEHLKPGKLRTSLPHWKSKNSM